MSPLVQTDYHVVIYFSFSLSPLNLSSLSSLFLLTLSLDPFSLFPHSDHSFFSLSLRKREPKKKKRKWLRWLLSLEDSLQNWGKWRRCHQRWPRWLYGCHQSCSVGSREHLYWEAWCPRWHLPQCQLHPLQGSIQVYIFFLFSASEIWLVNLL